MIKNQCYLITSLLFVTLLTACTVTVDEVNHQADSTIQVTVPEPDYTLTADQTHNKFSSTIPPVITVPSGSVIEVFTQEATDQQLTIDSTVDDLANMSFDPIHFDPGSPKRVSIRSFSIRIESGFRSDPILTTPWPLRCIYEGNFHQNIARYWLFGIPIRCGVSINNPYLAACW